MRHAITPPLADEPARPTRRRKPANAEPEEQPAQGAEPTVEIEPTAQEPNQERDDLADLAGAALALTANEEPAEGSAQQSAQEPGGSVLEFPRTANWGSVNPSVTIPRADDSDEDEDEEEPKERDPDLPPRTVDHPAPIASGRARLCTTTVTIAVELSEHEVNERARKLAETTNEEDRLKAEKSAFLSNWNGQMKGLQELRRTLSESVRLGKEEVEMHVHVEADYDRGVAEHVETTTGRVVDSRPLTVDEMNAGRQRRLPGM